MWLTIPGRPGRISKVEGNVRLALIFRITASWLDRAIVGVWEEVLAANQAVEDAGLDEWILGMRCNLTENT